MSVVLEERPVEVAEVIKEGVVTVLIKKSYPKGLVDAIERANEDLLITETENSHQISGQYIRIFRSEVEKTTGKLTDAKWRILFINRNGNINKFDNHEFAIGTPKPVQIEEVEQKETVQLNIRIEKGLKDQMECFRGVNMLNINQNDFVSEALREYIDSLKREIV